MSNTGEPLPVCHQALDFIIGDKSPLQTDRSGSVRSLEEHIPLAQKPLGPRLVENNPAIHSGGDRKSYAGREIGFDQAGDHID